MPLRDGVEHVPSLGLPPGIAAGAEVLVCRFTGEVFVDYRCGEQHADRHTLPIGTTTTCLAQSMRHQRQLPSPPIVPLLLWSTPRSAQAHALSVAHSPQPAHACHYSAYAECLDLYRQRVWTCRFTGTGKLTYEQALTSEIKARALASKVRYLRHASMSNAHIGLCGSMCLREPTLQDDGSAI